MAEEGNLLSDESVRKIAALVDDFAKQRGNPANRPPAGDYHAEENPGKGGYIALTPGGGIPALQAGAGEDGRDVPGSAECAIYRILRNPESLAYELREIHSSELVFNLGGAVSGDTFCPVLKDKFGSWLVSASTSNISNSDDCNSCGAVDCNGRWHEYEIDENALQSGAVTLGWLPALSIVEGAYIRIGNNPLQTGATLSLGSASTPSLWINAAPADVANTVAWMGSPSYSQAFPSLTDPTEVIATISVPGTAGSTGKAFIGFKASLPISCGAPTANEDCSSVCWDMTAEPPVLPPPNLIATITAPTLPEIDGLVVPLVPNAYPGEPVTPNWVSGDPNYSISVPYTDEYDLILALDCNSYPDGHCTFFLTLCFNTEGAFCLNPNNCVGTIEIPTSDATCNPFTVEFDDLQTVSSNSGSPTPWWPDPASPGPYPVKVLIQEQLS
jgi:hypothetical protein